MPIGGLAACTSAVNLRDYQHESVIATMAEWQQHRAALIVMATGLGKTVVGCEIMRHRLSKRENGQCIFVAHRRELINQTAATIATMMPDMRVGIEMAESRTHTYGWNTPDIVVASQQTLQHDRRLKRFRPETVGTLVFDEAHHAMARSWRKIADHFMLNPECKLLGLTATPDRMDGIGLGHLFDTCAFRMDLRDGVSQGWLCEPKIKPVVVANVDISRVHVTAGELNQRELSDELEKKEAVISMTEPLLAMTADGRRTIVFCASIKQAEMTADEINAVKPGSAIVVSSKTPDDKRAAMMECYGRGEHQYLVNVDIATEGWDDPCEDEKGVQVVAMMRMTMSRAKYVQMVGRGARTVKGLLNGLASQSQRLAAIESSVKPHFDIIDFMGITGKHRIICALDVLAGDHPDEVIKTANEILRSDEGKSTDEAIEQAKQYLEEERERAERQAAEFRKTHLVKVEYKVVERDPWGWATHAATTAPAMQRARQATKAQRDRLERHFGEPPNDLTFAAASRLIDAVKDKPTIKQAFWLRKFGFDPGKYTAKQAKGILAKRFGR